MAEPHFTTVIRARPGKSTPSRPAEAAASAALLAADLSPAARRVRMLLVDRAGDQAYAFDPESADIQLIPPEVESVLRASQAGEAVPEALLEALLEVLGLDGDPEVVASEPAYDRWGVTVHLNHVCNLACEYCYADGRTSDSDGNVKGAYGGHSSVISDGVLAEGMEKFMRDAPTDDVVISFLGGEPLLSETRFVEAIRIIDEKASKYGRRPTFQLTTNGTRNTPEILRCLQDHGFSVVVSVDGDRATHNRQRPKAGGAESYDQVLRGVGQLRDAGVRLGVRMTAIRGRPGIEAAHRSLAQAEAEAVGFQFHMYGGDALRPFAQEERERLFAHYVAVAHAILDGDPGARKLTTIRDVLQDIATKNKKQHHCAAGRWSNTLTPNGDVYPCHRFAGMAQFLTGNVLEDGFTFASQAQFEDNTVSSRVVRRDGTQNCALCYAHNTCGGGCAQIAAANTGNIDELPPFFCQETRLRVQAAVRALVERLVARPQPDA